MIKIFPHEQTSTLDKAFRSARRESIIVMSWDGDVEKLEGARDVFLFNNFARLNVRIADCDVLLAKHNGNTRVMARNLRQCWVDITHASEDELRSFVHASPESQRYEDIGRVVGHVLEAIFR